jgi:hypothetical protein
MRAADAADALAAIVSAVATRELTKLVEGFARVLETVDHEERLRALEGKLGNASKP